jgi:ribosome-binding protein aMBF1 (putative translation factor)
MIDKYFWDLKEASLKETHRILKDSTHPQFAQRMTVLLSRCDKPKELFSILPKKEFVEVWPRIRSYWVKRMRRSDSRDWWETIYEQLVEADRGGSIRAKGMTPAFFRNIGRVIKEARIEKGLSQRELALRIGTKQPDISRVEEGKKNMTLFTLMRLCAVLGIKQVELEEDATWAQKAREREASLPRKRYLSRSQVWGRRRS